MSLLHDRLANSMLLFALAAAAWGLITFARRRSIDGNYWGVLAVGEIAFLAEAVLGILLFMNGSRPRQPIHILPAAVIVSALPLYHTISKGRDDSIAALSYAVLSLLLAGVILGARMTGG